MAKAPLHPARAAAKATSQVRYNTGQPCAKGHDADRYTSNGFCVACDKAKSERYHARNPGLGAKWARERRAKDPSGHRAEVKRWKERNREKAKAAMKRWIEANIDYVRATRRVIINRRRSRIVGNGGTFTLKDIQTLHEHQRGRCAVCPSMKSLEIDHVHPIVLGGSSDPSNLQLLCLPCNRSKGGKTMDQWLLGLV